LINYLNPDPTQTQIISNFLIYLVARHAQDLLAAESSTALNKALAELAVLKKSHSSITTHESSHPFTECATFADDVKSTYSF